MNTNNCYKIIALICIFSVASCKVKMQKEAKEVAKVNTEVYNEENPYLNSNKSLGYQSNIDAYFKSNTSSKVILPFETEEEYQARMQWWKDAKYGMFIHYGLYSILGGEY